MFPFESESRKKADVLVLKQEEFVFFFFGEGFTFLFYSSLQLIGQGPPHEGAQSVLLESTNLNMNLIP